MIRQMPQRNRWAALRPFLVVLLCTTLVGAQTKITPPKNKYTPEQDVKIGQEAAAEVRREYPLIEDRQIDGYLDELGQSLVAQAPADLNHAVFQYSFTAVNLKDINAFALPGGPMFVNRGMFDAASSEGEVAGVLAHELSHVLLRHGTANASKAQNPWLQLGQIAGQIGGAMVGGAAGSASVATVAPGISEALIATAADTHGILQDEVPRRAGAGSLETSRNEDDMSVKLVATNDTLTAHARGAITEIEKKLDNPVAIVIVALDESGTYKLRTYSDVGKIKDSDMYSRAEAIIERQRKAILE